MHERLRGQLVRVGGMGEDDQKAVELCGSCADFVCCLAGVPFVSPGDIDAERGLAQVADQARSRRADWQACWRGREPGSGEAWLQAWMPSAIVFGCGSFRVRGVRSGPERVLALRCAGVEPLVFAGEVEAPLCSLEDYALWPAARGLSSGLQCARAA